MIRLGLIIFGYSTSWLALLAIIPVSIIAIAVVFGIYFLLFWLVALSDVSDLVSSHMDTKINAWISVGIAHLIWAVMFWVIWAVYYLSTSPIATKLQ